MSDFPHNILVFSTFFSLSNDRGFHVYCRTNEFDLLKENIDLYAPFNNVNQFTNDNNYSKFHRLQVTFSKLFTLGFLYFKLDCRSKIRDIFYLYTHDMDYDDIFSANTRECFKFVMYCEKLSRESEKTINRWSDWNPLPRKMQKGEQQIFSGKQKQRHKQWAK